MGEVIGTEEFPATAVGYRNLLRWARASGTVRQAGVEGTGSFGAALSRYLLAQDVAVFDVNRFDRADRRRRGKSDPLDAENAARAVLVAATAFSGSSGRRVVIDSDWRVLQRGEGCGDLVCTAAPLREAVAGEVERALARRTDFEDRHAQQRRFDAARRIGAHHRIGAGQAAACTDPRIGHHHGENPRAMKKGSEDAVALRGMWSDDQPPVAAGHAQTVKEEVGLLVEPIGPERLARPDGDARGTVPRATSQQLLQIPPLDLMAEAGQGIEAGLAQDVDLGLRVTRPGSCERDVTFAHDDDVAAVEGGPRGRLLGPRSVLDVHRVRAVSLRRVNGQCSERTCVVADQNGVRPDCSKDPVEPRLGPDHGAPGRLGTPGARLQQHGQQPDKTSQPNGVLPDRDDVPVIRQLQLAHRAREVEKPSRGRAQAYALVPSGQAPLLRIGREVDEHAGVPLARQLRENRQQGRGVAGGPRQRHDAAPLQPRGEQARLRGRHVGRQQGAQLGCVRRVVRRGGSEQVGDTRPGDCVGPVLP
ncbi:transposase [Streptomyces sp. NPDC047453]|uniref:IS110 family transposase n=1 Tax=Streptomyces sp. NPDC047453 TaxID=3154812 RepID=UPI0033E7F77C